MIRLFEMQLGVFRWCQKEYVPRFGSRVVVFLHLFSGERRFQDIQYYLERITPPEGCVLRVLSVDVIFSASGDLANPANQRRWIRFALSGCIIACYAGPPCESWSRARCRGGVAGLSYGDGGPRVLRTAEVPQGLEAVRIRELHQILQANRLLLFAIQLFHAMVRVRRLMVVEHPGEPDRPDEAWLPSIWKLFTIRQLVDGGARGCPQGDDSTRSLWGNFAQAYVASHRMRAGHRLGEAF